MGSFPERQEQCEGETLCTHIIGHIRPGDIGRRTMCWPEGQATTTSGAERGPSRDQKKYKESGYNQQEVRDLKEMGTLCGGKGRIPRA